MALAVVGVAVVAAVASFGHASALVRARGEFGWTGRLIPLKVDGLIRAVRGLARFAGVRAARVWRPGITVLPGLHTVIALVNFLR
jgi:hypothetical protein